MPVLSRRVLLRASALAGVALASAACTVTTSGNTTVLTLNVAKVTAYGQAGLNAVTTVIALAGVIPSLALYVPAMQAAEAALAAALDTFGSAAGSTVTINYDDTNWKTRVDSILSDLSTVATTIGATIAGMPTSLSSSVKSQAETALDALNTILSVFRALLLSVSAVPTRMTEGQALKTLGVVR